MAQAVPQKRAQGSMLNAVVSGLLNGAMQIPLCIALASVVFSGDLRPYFPVGIGLFLVGNAMVSAIEGVNSSQMKATDLYQKMVTDPNSVDVHDVTLAAAEASMSLNLAKTVVERAVQAYRDIINMR